MKRIVSVFLVLLFSVVALHSAPRKKVACIGNSITYGLRVDEREKNCYPTKLQILLGDEYEVGNFGHSGATLLRKGHNPYVKTDEWRGVKEMAPDIAVIHLGTNDTDPRNWPNYSEEFVCDYKALIDTLRMLNPEVRVIVANMAPIEASHPRFKTGTRIWRDSIRNATERVARLAGVELIDFAHPLRDFPNLLPDAVHPNVKGASRLADYVYGAISGRWGGLRMPEVWQDGMVVPWNRKFFMPGFADADVEVSVNIKGKTYRTRSDKLGKWRVEIDPLTAGGSFPITVVAGDDKIILRDVTAGEVWLASGQSNMAFMLSQGSDTPEDVVADSLIRFFDMLPIAYTDNRNVWDEETLSKINELKHYKKSSWRQPMSRTSAVAWHFARNLADSLQNLYGFPVPVGVVSNAVGGSGTESWIDIETLEHTTPDVLVKWMQNDWIQPWVRQRAAENAGSDKPGVRHPYEPGYLFASGIRSLEHFPFTGVIWYQGESNAHNVELHETYFRNLVTSWRNEFDNQKLPFVFAQLSSLNRPSWPSFRDSQRRLADSIPNVWMIVTSDCGNPSDVHPMQKGPVGRRMALAALANVYGRNDIVWQGPTPVSVELIHGKNLLVKFLNSKGLSSSDGEKVRGFEMAETEGMYLPAEVTIVDGGVILSNPEVRNPRYVRYGWKPFTDANLVNSDSLPTSTFKMGVR